MKNTKIEWCDHTFNPWIGCTKVSPGCANCYAEAQDKRWGKDRFGAGKARQRTSDSYWNQPLKWNEEAIYQKTIAGAADASVRSHRVFCASLADWLDDDVPIEWLADLLALIQVTPYLDWLLLTKRPENWRSRLIAARGVMFADPLDVADHVDAWLDGRHWLNVWLGTTVENQEMTDKRIAELLKIPAKVRFLSCEPLAHVADICIKKLSDETAIWSSCSNVEGEGFSVTLGDCRRAKAALEGGAK